MNEGSGYVGKDIDYLLYDSNWNLVYEGNGGFDGEYGTWNRFTNSSNIINILTVNQSYYMTRADELIPMDNTLPEHVFDSNIIIKGIKEYAIYNGNSFDKIYTSNIVDEKLDTLESIVKGRASGYVFDTLSDMYGWLDNNNNVTNLKLGDNLYIRDVDVPDYWWDGTQVQELETQKVDLTEYAKKSDLNEYVTQEQLGDIEAALERIIAIQNSLIGGVAE